MATDNEREWLSWAARVRAGAWNDDMAIKAVEFYAVVGLYGDPERARWAIREYCRRNSEGKTSNA